MRPPKKTIKVQHADVSISSSGSGKEEDEGEGISGKHVYLENEEEEQWDTQPIIKRIGSVIDPDYDENMQKKLSEILLLEDSTEVLRPDLEVSYVEQKPLAEVPDFFEVLGEVPSLSDISVEEEEEEEEEEVVVIDEGPDKGVFVDPLTGEKLSSSSSKVHIKRPSKKIKHEKELKVEETEQDEIVEEIEEEFSELDISFEFDVEEEVVEKVPEDNVLETLMEIDAQKKIVIAPSVDMDEVKKQEEANEFAIGIEKFLNLLFDRIVEICEYVDPVTILRNNLDKKKLFVELRKKVQILYDEQRDRTFLNRKVVEHFRRKKSFRPITEDNPETVQYEIEKYRQATLELDAVVGKEEEKKAVTRTHINNLIMKESELRRTAEEEVITFETMVKNALIRDTFEKLPGSVNYQLLKMARLRNEISDVRFRLIEKLHNVAVLTEKLEVLENLGNGLRMRDFEHLQTETQALDKKIEERNAELNKLRARCNGDFHIMAHMREKQEMLCNTITLQQTALEELQDQKTLCRQFLFNMKLKRGQIRKEIQDLSFQGGLLDKPELMLDYDETVRKVKEKRAANDHLRWKYEANMKKLAALETKCLEGNVGSK